MLLKWILNMIEKQIWACFLNLINNFKNLKYYKVELIPKYGKDNFIEWKRNYPKLIKYKTMIINNI